jgi:hypothetical protein
VIPQKLSRKALTNYDGDPAIDRTLKHLITAYQKGAEGAVHSIYLEGSRADASALPTSDVDLTVVYHHTISSDVEHRIAVQLKTAMHDWPPVELDVERTTVEQLLRGATPMFKRGSTLLYGPDLRPEVPLMPIDRWTRDRMHAAYWLATHALGRPPVVRVPLPYPDPSGAFWGYDNRTITTPDGQNRPSTRNLVRVTGWMATALVALHAGQYIARKRDVPALYEQWVGGSWSGLLHEIHTQCRDAWHYLVPTDRADHKRLQDLCTQTLLFENDFLNHYHHFVLSELRGDQEGRRHARFVLGLLPFDDGAVQQALYEAGGILTQLDP